jgi:hypothetical protein
MKIVSTTPGVTYPSAVELPNRGLRLQNGTHKSASQNGSAGKRHRMLLPGKMSAELQKLAQDQTRANRMMLLIEGGKRRWIRVADWEARQQAA